MPKAPGQSTPFLYYHAIVVTALILILMACSVPFVSTDPPAATPTTANTSATIQADASPAIPAASATPAATDLPLATITAELTATVMAALPPTTTPDPSGVPSFGDIAGANLLPLDLGPDNPPAWAAFTHGVRGFSTQQDHAVTIYNYQDNSLQEVSRLILDTADYVDAQGVTVVWSTPGEVWLEVQSGVGAHGGCFDLLRFDGTTLTSEAASCNASPFAGEVRDVNADETPDIVLNQTDYYIFCYACDVRLPQFQVLRWDGSQMVEVQLTPLEDSASDDLRRLNNRAIELARAGLWKEAQETMNQIADPSQDETVNWNAALVSLHAEAHTEQINEGAYPLLGTIFYGDYPAALDVVRSYPVEEIFGTPSALVAGTVAEGWESALTNQITSTTTLAIQARPDLAAAYFLRGWSLFVSDPGNPQVLADLERAAQLAPNEPLFAQGVAYLHERSTTDGPEPASDDAPPEGDPPAEGGEAPPLEGDPPAENEEAPPPES